MTAKEFIDLMRPKHCRNSCSDESIENGFFTRNGDTWHGRCTRCMYLELIQNSKVPDGFDPDECNG